MIKCLSSKKKVWVGTNSPLEWTDPRQPYAAPPKRSACHSGVAWLYQMPILGGPGKSLLVAVPKSCGLGHAGSISIAMNEVSLSIFTLIVIR